MEKPVPIQLSRQVEDVYRETEYPAQLVEQAYESMFAKAITVEHLPDVAPGEWGYVIHRGQVHVPDGAVFRDDELRKRGEYPSQPDCDLLMPGEAVPVLAKGNWWIVENRGGYAVCMGHTRGVVRKLKRRGVVLRPGPTEDY